MSLTMPTPIIKPFCNSGTSVAPPVNADTFVANQETGFPASQSTPLPVGTPVNRGQMNGVLQLYSNLILWMNAGGLWTFDADLSAENGGYPEGTILYSFSDNTWQRSLVANNTANFVTTPSYLNDGINWTSAFNCGDLSAKTVTAIGSILGFNGSGVTANGNVLGNSGQISTTLGNAVNNLGVLSGNNITLSRQVYLYLSGINTQTGQDGGGIRVANGSTYAQVAVNPTSNRPWFSNSSGGNAGVALLSDLPLKFFQSNITGGTGTAPYYANGIWVSGNGNAGVYYSTNGTTWTQSNITSGYFYTPYYANGIWVIGTGLAGIYYSTDGITWTQSNITSGGFNSPYYANGKWVIGTGNGGGNGIYYSTDGITWTQSNITNGSFSNPYYANGKWVIGTNFGIYFSTDGITWTQSNITSGGFNSPYYANGIWVISGGGSVYFSTDGTTWTQSNISYGSNPYYANGKWVIGTGINGIYYSTDGITWTQSNITTGSFYTPYYANGIWVIGTIGTGNGIYYSTDGITWTQSNITSGAFSGPYYANGIWVISGSGFLGGLGIYYGFL